MIAERLHILKKIFTRFLLAVSLTVLASFNQGSADIYNLKDGTISFFSETPLENIDATNNSIQSILNTSTQDIAFIVPVRKFHFKSSLMEEHFNEKYLESDKYPNATYSGKINGAVTYNKDGVYPVTSTGKMTMHGVEKDITQPGTISVKNGEISLASNFNVALKDYNITVPQLVFENIADTVLVKVNLTYQSSKK